MGNKRSLCLFPQGWFEKNKWEGPVPTSKLRRKNTEYWIITVIFICCGHMPTHSHSHKYDTWSVARRFKPWRSPEGIPPVSVLDVSRTMLQLPLVTCKRCLFQINFQRTYATNHLVKLCKGLWFGLISVFVKRVWLLLECVGFGGI